MATSTIVIATFLAAVSLPLCLTLTVGMLPTAIAFLFDRHPRRYAACAVGAGNAAGLVWPVAGLLHADLSLGGALHMLSEPRNWLLITAARRSAGASARQCRWRRGCSSNSAPARPSAS